MANKTPPQYILDEFRQRCESSLKNIEAIYDSPPSHEDHHNPESIEGVYIKNIRNFSKYVIESIETKDSWLDISSLVGLLISITRMEGNLASARHFRMLLGRKEYTVKSAIIEAQYFSGLGKEYVPIFEQQELEIIKQREAKRLEIEAKKQAGRDSGKIEAKEKLKRNDHFKNEVKRLCLEGGMGFIEASETISKEFKGTTWELSARRIRDYVKNPYKT